MSKECKLPLDEEEYVQSFKVELMDVVLQWCRGAKFADICKVRLAAMVSMFDSLTRCIDDGPV